MGPKRSIVVAAAVAPLPDLIPPPPPSPLIQRLRTDWRWAGISQFIWTFSDAFGLLDWDIEALEADLDQDEMSMIPDLIAKMLYALTYNRQINRDNAFNHLRKQYVKRDLDHPVLGTEEEPREWAALGLGEKIRVMWDLCEWQMADPARFRALLKGEEEAAAWRIEPVGWDKEGSTYYLFDDNRLWVQRLRPAPPRPAKQASQKAKRGSNKRARPEPDTSSPAKAPARPKASHKKRARSPSPDLTPPPPISPDEDTPVSGRRQRAQVAFYGNPVSTVAALKRGGLAKPATPSISRGTRSSARNEPVVAEPVAPVETPSRSSAKAASASTSQSRGTRSTRRTRDTGDEWQTIPAEWLEPETGAPQEDGKKAASKAGSKKANGVTATKEVESELSSLTDEEEGEVQLDSAETRHDDHEDDKVEAQDDVDVTEAGGDAEKGGEASEPADADGATETKVETKEDSKADAVGTTGPAADVDMEDAGAEPKPAEVMKEEEEETDEVKLAAKEAATVPEGFVEWEAVCITLYDWRTFPEKFAKSRDPDEKNLYTLLVEAVGPTVIQALVAKEQERIRQEAINNRKRSSRIATKELAKEEIARREKAQREMEERMEKSRRDENSKQRQEANVISQEKAREDRVKEREDRIAAREIANAQKAEEEQRSREKADRARIRRQRRREGEVVETSEESEREGSARPSAKRSRVNTPVVAPQTAAGRKRSADEGWELNCEICRKTGWNLDDDNEDVVSCDDCGRWQHTECHNRQDAAEGRRPRNWEKVDFQCKECRRKAARKRQRLSHEPRSSPLAHAPFVPNGNGNGNGHTNGIHPAVNFNTGNGPSNGMPPISAIHGPLPPPAVLQAFMQGARPSQPLRPPSYPHQHPQQQMQQRSTAPQSGYPPYQLPQYQAQQFPQGYRPQLQAQYSISPQQHASVQGQSPSQRYPIPAGQYRPVSQAQQPAQQYAPLGPNVANRQYTGSAPPHFQHQQQQQHLLNPALQNGLPRAPMPGSGSIPPLQGRPGGPGYASYAPQPLQGSPRTAHPGPPPQYASNQQQPVSYQQRPTSQHGSQPGQGQYGAAQPRQSPAQATSGAPMYQSQVPPKRAAPMAAGSKRSDDRSGTL